MRSLVFEGRTWEAYEAMWGKDKRLHQALCKVLKDMLRSDDPSSGLGKPEPLKHNLSGLWSRRISQKDRLIYRFDDKAIYIFAIGGHSADTTIKAEPASSNSFACRDHAWPSRLNSWS